MLFCPAVNAVGRDMDVTLTSPVMPTLIPFVFPSIFRGPVAFVTPTIEERVTVAVIPASIRETLRASPDTPIAVSPEYIFTAAPVVPSLSSKETVPVMPTVSRAELRPGIMPPVIRIPAIPAVTLTVPCIVMPAPEVEPATLRY